MRTQVSTFDFYRWRPSLKIRELHIPFSNAQQIFRRLKSKYPTLDAHLVITSGFGQSQLTLDAFALFDRVASMFTNSRERRELLILFDTHRELTRRNSDLKCPFIKEVVNALRERMCFLLDVAEVIETTQIQLRFGDLDYDLIARLQKDPLVDRALTTQSRASIVISLGTLQQLQRWKHLDGQRERVGVHMEQQNAAV